MTDIRRTVDAVWRIDGGRVVATLARYTGDLGEAEDLAQEAVAEALESWPASGVPQNPGAWLTSVAKRRAIDGWRRREKLTERYRLLANELEEGIDAEWQPIPDDMQVTRRGEDTLVRHRRARLLGVALVPHGAYGQNATVLSVRFRRDDSGGEIFRDDGHVREAPADRHRRR